MNTDSWFQVLFQENLKMAPAQYRFPVMRLLRFAKACAQIYLVRKLLVKEIVLILLKRHIVFINKKNARSFDEDLNNILLNTGLP